MNNFNFVNFYLCILNGSLKKDHVKSFDLVNPLDTCTLFLKFIYI